MRSSPLLLVVCCLIVVSVASPALAFEEENQTDPPCAGCLGSNDPCCEGGGGGGGGSDPVPGCETCSWIPEGPDGQPGGYICVTDDPFRNTTYNDCVDGGDSPCTHQTYCVVA